MTDNDRQPIRDVLAGMEIHPLEEGWTLLEAFLLIKALDGDGRSAWVYRTTHRLNREELLGALTVQMRLLESELLEEWESD